MKDQYLLVSLMAAILPVATRLAFIKYRMME